MTFEELFNSTSYTLPRNANLAGEFSIIVSGADTLKKLAIERVSPRGGLCLQPYPFVAFHTNEDSV